MTIRCPTPYCPPTLAWTICCPNKKCGCGGSFAASIGDGAATTFNVGHGLNSEDVIIQVREIGSPSPIAIPDLFVVNVNTVRVTFAVAPTNNAYRVVVQK